MPASIRSDDPSKASHQSPLRRQRKDTEDGASLRNQPLRKRNKLSNDLFKPDASLNGSASISSANGHASNGHASDQMKLDFPMRSKLAIANSKRIANNDGGVTLSDTKSYSIKRLPSLPDSLRPKDTNYRAYAFPWTPLALALTHTHAFIWDSSSSLPHPRTFIFALPSPKSSNDSLPTGSLVNGGSTGETGLLVISPRSGNVTYWENIETADSLNLFSHQREGVRGTMNGIWSGERVIAIQDAEHAGFLLLFTTGRTAQLLLRDSQSKPNINVNFLRTLPKNPPTGFFGGLKSVFNTGTYLKDTIAVKSWPSKTRGQVSVLLGSAAGIFQTWQIGWSGHAVHRYEIDASQQLKDAIKELIPPSSEPTFKVWDVALTIDHAHSDALVAAGNEDDSFDILVLVSVHTQTTTDLLLIQMTIFNDNAVVSRIIPLNTYAAPLRLSKDWNASIQLVKNSGTACLVFGNAVVLVSLASPHQDTIYLRQSDGYLPLGGNLVLHDEKRNISSFVLFIQNSGVLRLTIRGQNPEQDDGIASIKSRIEQAVFFGSLQDNPLDLYKPPEVHAKPADICIAAEQVSKDILASNPAFISQIASSMEPHLESRAQYLRHLAQYLKVAHPPLKRETKWALLADAERMEAARQLWSCHNSRPKEKDDELRLLSEAIEFMEEEYKTIPDPEPENLDSLRQWFLKDVDKVETVIAWIYMVIKQHLSINEDFQAEQDVLQVLSDANDIMIHALESAFAFRMKNQGLYNLAEENLKDGVLQDHYEDLPEFWTSSCRIDENIEALITDGSNFITESIEESSEDRPTLPIEGKVAEDNVRLISLNSRVHQERFLWLQSRPGKTKKQEAIAYGQKFQRELSSSLAKLSDIDMTYQGMNLAEKYRDLEALVKLMRSEASHLSQILDQPLTEAGIQTLSPSEKNFGRLARKKANDRITALEDRTHTYFNRYGMKWANAFYTSFLETRLYSTLLDQSGGYKIELTKFLRSKPSLKKISWLNESITEHDYVKAGSDLMEVADIEDDIWNKRIELSLAKLHILASQENEAQPFNMSNLALETDRDATLLVAVQDQIHAHVKPNIWDATDSSAALGLTMEKFGVEKTKKRLALQSLLERGLEALIALKAMGIHQVIDVLTLMDHQPCAKLSDNIAGLEFFLALQVLHCGNITDQTQEYDLLSKIIWRRCYIEDDWEEMNNTASKTDADIAEDLEDTTLFKTLFEAGKAGKKESSRSNTRLRMLTTAGLFHGGHAISMPQPAAILGAGSSPTDYMDRFHSLDLSEPIARDVAQEDDILRRYMDEFRLDHWIVETQALVEKELGHSISMSQSIGAVTELKTKKNGVPDAWALGVAVK